MYARLIVASALFFGMTLESRARAQLLSPATQTSSPNVPSLSYQMNDVARERQDLYESGHSLRNTGILVTVAGAVVEGIGLALYLNTRGNCSQESGCQAIREIFVAPTMYGSLVLGGAGIAAGIPLWVVGSSRMSRAQRMGYSPVGLVPGVAPVPGGAVAGLTVKFF